MDCGRTKSCGPCVVWLSLLNFGTMYKHSWKNVSHALSPMSGYCRKTDETHCDCLQSEH